MLADRGDQAVPAKSTITAILRRHDLIAPAESAKRQPYQRFEHAQRTICGRWTSRAISPSAAVGAVTP